MTGITGDTAKDSLRDELQVVTVDVQILSTCVGQRSTAVRDQELISQRDLTIPLHRVELLRTHALRGKLFRRRADSDCLERICTNTAGSIFF